MPRFLTNLTHEKVNIVKLFTRLNEFSSVRHINIARACLKGYSHIAINSDIGLHINIVPVCLEEYMPCLQKYVDN